MCPRRHESRTENSGRAEPRVAAANLRDQAGELEAS